MRVRWGLAVLLAALSVGAVASAGLPKYRVHLPAGESQQEYQQKCGKSASLRALLAVPRFGRRYPPVGLVQCYLAPYTASEKTGWGLIDVQATWHVPNGINGRMAILGFPAAIYPVGLHTVELRINACFNSPCSGKNVWKKTYRLAGLQWSNVYAGNTVGSAPKPPSAPPAQYSGQTSQGNDISLTVSTTAVTNVSVDIIDAPCSDDESPETGGISFARIPVTNGHFSATSTDAGSTMHIDGQISGSTITGTVEYSTPGANGTCDSGPVAFTAQRTS